jgi:NAD(P)-dependent dehydrogenase (short-subunit alcohol dehydrogenase family)
MKVLSQTIEITNGEFVKNLFDLTDKVIAVTGAAGVLAGGTAKYLQEQGAYVIYLDLRQEAVDKTIVEAKQISDKCCGYACKCAQFGWASGALAATMLTDYAQPADEDQLWSIWKGNARVKR